ncbi:type IV pilin [Haloarchaeobius baliensis]|uniref:type IV pilin n=1 Tax=Haloarchaeobius baliensis TaxID=1670458 RepID=UPI003F88445C
MQLRHLFSNDDAVSPVIGVILMVAITVILAATIGAFVLGIGTQSETAPQNQFTWDFTASGDRVVVEHGGGAQLNGNQLGLVGAWSSGGDCQIVPKSGLTAGDLIVNNTNGSDQCSHTGANGDRLRISWTSTNGEQSQIISQKVVP